MRITRYTAWDGSQRIELSPERILERLGDILPHTDDLRAALEWLTRHGGDFGDVQVLGLDDLIDQLRKTREDLFESGGGI